MDYMTMNFNRNGGSGTSDYSQLSNKPRINDVTLSGNKTSADLGLMPEYEVDNTPTESSNNLITSGGVWSADKGIKDRLQGSKTASSTSGTIEIPDYGMTESIQMYFKPTQDLHGYDKPWAGGAGKNKLPLVLSDIKALNTTGTWSGNSYSVNGVTFEILTDSADNVTEIVVNGTSTQAFSFSLTDKVEGMSGLKYNGAGAGTTNNKCLIVGYWNTPTEYVTDGRVYGGNDYTLLDYPYMSFDIFMQNAQTLTNESFYPMIRLATETDPTFEPYSNICPISGQDNATFEWTDSHDDDWELPMNFGKTCYGGFCTFDGQVYSTWSHIASYNGETLSGEWVSDRDEYRIGTTPTIGAEVAYENTQATDCFRVTPPANLNLTDDYPIEYNGYMASIGYQPKNTVLEKAKQYTNQEIAKLGLPTPPTIDGTYHLECSVSSGNPTITWVLNS